VSSFWITSCIGECEQRRVDPVQAQRRERDHRGEQGAGDAAADDRQPRRHRRVQDQQPGAVAAARVHRELAEVPDPGDAEDEVPARVEQHDDQGGDEHVHPVLAGVDQRQQRREQDEGA
jgi:hypothetical protein